MALRPVHAPLPAGVARRKRAKSRSRRDGCARPALGRHIPASPIENDGRGKEGCASGDQHSSRDCWELSWMAAFAAMTF